MGLTAKEQAANREAFRRMSLPEKADYVLSYYKLPIVLILILVYTVCYGVYRHVSHREALLYTAYINVAVGEDADSALSDGFVRFCGENPQKNEVSVYHDLYLSEDAALVNHEYAYASRLKLMAAVNAKQLDIVLMNREAYDLLSGDGYLMELPPLLQNRGWELYQDLLPYLVENEVILEDNAVAYSLNEAESYHAVTAPQVNGVEVTDLPGFEAFGFTDAVYVGVILNSPRLDMAAGYLAYLVSDMGANRADSRSPNNASDE